MDKPSVKPLSSITGAGDPFNFVSLATVEEKPIHWAWKPYIPRGALTMLIGDGGYGKSWLTCAVAADLSTGRALPGQEPLPPQKILMVGAEDGLGQVIKPKMRLLKANVDNIVASDRGFTLDKSSMIHLVRHIKEYDVAIVFFDPLVVYLGGKVDMFRANEARSMLTLLRDVAADTDTAIVAVHHVRKSGEGTQQHKVMGSADFVNGVRSTLLVDISKGGQRYMAHVKSNWSKNGPTLAYNFGENGFQWQGEYSGTPDSGHEISKTARGVVQDWLREQLKGGPRAAMEMITLAADLGYSERTLSRAKQGLVASHNNGDFWTWSLNPEEMARIQREEGMPATDEASQEQIKMLGQGPLAMAQAILAAKGNK
jgi:hypothetical protein